MDEISKIQNSTPNNEPLYGTTCVQIGAKPKRTRSAKAKKTVGGDYAKKLKDPRWQKKRLQILERDNWTCRDTGKTDEELQVHHCWYAKGTPWETPDEYLITLSKSAHKRRQALELRAKKALGLIMARCVDDPEDELDSLAGLVKSLEAFVKDHDGLPVIVGYDAFSNWAIHELNPANFPDTLFEALYRRFAETRRTERGAEG